MVKNQHSKDRLFITATEWRDSYGGKRKAGNINYRPLPFNCCALTLSPFETPVCNKNGVTFDLLNIVPYIQKHHKDPVSGEHMTTKQLIRLNISKNNDGQWHCPVTFKIFNDNSHIIVIKNTGNVYSYEAVEELNIKAKNWTDLLTCEPFTRKDIITIQNPMDPEHMKLRDINNFKHFQELREETNQQPVNSESNIRVDPTTSLIFREIENRKLEKGKEEDQKRILENEEKKKELEDPNISITLKIKRLGITTEDLTPGKQVTTNKVSGSFTSTAVDIETINNIREATEHEINLTRWDRLRKLGQKGYAQIVTSHGNLNVEIFCDMTPRTAENFIGLCSKGYYNGVKFHRLIKDFMVQGGDPSGTGKGGESLWGKPFEDEFDSRLIHNKKGILSMANSGRNTNGSQFFITLRGCRHLDNVHTIFGHIVGGLETLSRMEEEETNKHDEPMNDIVILETHVFVNPIEEMERIFFEEMKAKVDERINERNNKPKEEKNERKQLTNIEDLSERKLPNLPLNSEEKGELQPQIKGVGKYLSNTIKSKRSHSVIEENSTTSENILQSENEFSNKKKRIEKTIFRDFSGW